MKHDYGYLDTNVFIHQLYENDPYRARSREILEDLKSDRATAVLSHVVVHELTYALLTRVPSMNNSRKDVCNFVLPYLSLESIAVADREVLISALLEWAENSGLGFAAALLKQYALQDGRPICSVNGSDFEAVPNSF